MTRKLLISIDPGNIRSAMVAFCPDGQGEIVSSALEENGIIMQAFEATIEKVRLQGEVSLKVFIELIHPRGMPVSIETIYTTVWVGELVKTCKIYNVPYELVDRKDVKMCLCGRSSAKDSNIRQAIIDLYGGKDKAIGLKKTPGPLYGIKADLWSSLAICIFARERV